MLISLSIFSLLFAQEFSIKINEKEARDILSDPKTLVKFIDSQKGEDPLTSSEAIAEKLINIVKKDQSFLKSLYYEYIRYETQYFNGPYVGPSLDKIALAFVAVYSLDYTKGNKSNDDYFKKIFEDYNNRNHRFIRQLALDKIKDLKYLSDKISEMVKNNSGEVSYSANDPVTEILNSRGRELYQFDPTLVDYLALDATDSLVREAAIRATSNVSILNLYINTGYIFGPDSRSYKEAASERLKELENKKRDKK